MAKKKADQEEQPQEQGQEQEQEPITVVSPGEVEHQEGQDPEQPQEEEEIFSVDTGRAGTRGASIDIELLKEVIAEAKDSMARWSKKLHTPVTSVNMPLTKFNAKLGISNSNANSLLYRIKHLNDASMALLKQEGVSLGSGKVNPTDKGAAYKLSPEKQKIVFTIVK